MMRVLVATNDRTFTPSLVRAYAEAGWEVVTGVDNLYYRSVAFDLVHLHWPEELIGWEMPTAQALNRLEETLAWLGSRTRVIATVHNLLPHRTAEHPLDRKLYNVVYLASDLIGHFSYYSRDRVRSLFAKIPLEKQVVHPPFLFTHLPQYQHGRGEARKNLGIRDDEFAILAFGSLREAAELELLKKGVRYSKRRRKRMIFAARLPGGSRLERGIRRVSFEMWKRSNSVINLEGYIEDCKVYSLFEAADAVLISRFGLHMNSGILPLAITVGTPIVAPLYGIYAEYLTGTGNELYKPGDSRDLARAIDRISQRDRNTLSGQNRQIAANWGWHEILKKCLAIC
jgi:hypothetical protein